MDVHDLPPEAGIRPLDIDRPPHILELLHRLATARAPALPVQPDERLVDERADLLGGCVLADDLQQLECVRLVRGADHPEEIVEHVPVVVEFLGGAFLGDAPALVE